MSAVIQVNDVSKRYRVGLSHATTLREHLSRLLTFTGQRDRSQAEIIWALRDISFAIQAGETVGIIGRNGAGKSTLLKILSRITEPTSGSIMVGGRVAAMLEVGTGFHPELTGIENIYLNGSILGMSRREVKSKLDAIIEFSGVEKFIHTPIKRYSSGMRLRLGFAVAAHLDAEILVVDEVLAVGDAAFQKKCLDTMGSLRERARTVLFVSHNLAAVENLCSRCIWIDGGRVRADGDTHEIVKAYMDAMVGGASGQADLGNTENRKGNGKVRFQSVELLAPDGTAQRVVRAGDPLVIRLHYIAHEPVPCPSLGLRLYTEMGTLVTETSTWHHGIHIPVLEPGAGHLDLQIDCLNLMPANYALSLWATDDNGAVVFDNVECAITLEVERANIYKSGKDFDSRCGIVFFPQKWDLSGMHADGLPLKKDAGECALEPR